MRRVLTWVAGIALIAAAALVLQVQPSEEQQQAPFTVTAQLGERVEGRTHAVTFTRAVAATAVHDDGGWAATGTWIVIDVEVEATRSESIGMLGLIELEVGDRLFRASERPPSLRDTVHAVGIPREGSIAFEVGELPLEGEATVRLARSLETRLDSMLTLPLDLGALEVLDDAEIRPPEWVS